MFVINKAFLKILNKKEYTIMFDSNSPEGLAIRNEIDLHHNPGLTLDDLKWLRAGFQDAIERRDIPVEGLTPVQLKRWREGLRDGHKFQCRYSDTYSHFLGIDDPDVMNAMMDVKYKKESFWRKLAERLPSKK